MQEQPHWRRLLLRTEETAERYEREVKAKKVPGSSLCNMCADKDAIKKEFTHWVLMENIYPYDRYFSKSDMLVLKRHSDEAGLHAEEHDELFALKHSDELVDSYDALLENFSKQSSIPGHYHIHLIEYKRHDGQPR